MTTRSHPPFAGPSARPAVVDLAPGVPEPRDGDEYPPIEQFLDELPSIEDYIADDPAPWIDSDGWADTSWQAFDWNRIASLGSHDARSNEPLTDWHTSDWVTGAESAAATGAGEVADALDRIASRIRSGELPIDQFRGMAPEAAIAAALALLLREQR